MCVCLESIILSGCSIAKAKNESVLVRGGGKKREGFSFNIEAVHVAPSPSSDIGQGNEGLVGSQSQDTYRQTMSDIQTYWQLSL